MCVIYAGMNGREGGAFSGKGLIFLRRNGGSRQKAFEGGGEGTAAALSPLDECMAAIIVIMIIMHSDKLI